MNYKSMKKNAFKAFFIALTLIFATNLGQAQSLEEGIAAHFPKLAPDAPKGELMGAMAQLDLLAAQHPGEWAAQYYACFAKVTVSYGLESAEQRDMLLDEADAYAKTMMELGAENSETFIMKAMVANGRLAVDGQARWQKYGAIFSENLEKAKALNADNPRIYYLKGTSLFYTPTMFGGGKAASVKYFEQAKPLFAKESKESLLVPYWGNEINEYYIAECAKPGEVGMPVEEEAPKEDKKKAKKEKKKKKEKN
mgnify:CR=1 FL=1